MRLVSNVYTDKGILHIDVKYIFLGGVMIQKKMMLNFNFSFLKSRLIALRHLKLIIL